MVYLKDYIDIGRILFLNPSTKMEALLKLIESSLDSDTIANPDGFRKAVLNRESIVSTGMGQGVAIPHVKTAHVKKFFITVGVFEDGIEWESLDGKPVRIAFLIGGPDNHEQYLQILAKLTLIIRNEQRRKAIIAARTGEEVLAQFERV